MVQVTGDILFGICIYINDSFLLFVSSCYTCAIFILIIYYTIVQFSHLFTFNKLSYLSIYLCYRLHFPGCIIRATSRMLHIYLIQRAIAHR